MKTIKTYETIMLEIEKLAKDPEANAVELTKLSAELAKQRDYLKMMIKQKE